MRLIAPLAALGLTLTLPTLALAQACATKVPPSAEAQDASATAIMFYNTTEHPMQIFWANYEGGLTPYGDPLPAGAEAGFDTFKGHQWYVSVMAPKGPSCVGPISAETDEVCQMRILYDNGAGMDGGFCEYGG